MEIKEKIENLVLEAVKEVSGENNISIETTFNELVFDSSNRARVLFLLEEGFERGCPILLLENELECHKNPNYAVVDLIKYVQKKYNQGKDKEFNFL